MSLFKDVGHMGTSSTFTKKPRQNRFYESNPWQLGCSQKFLLTRYKIHLD